MKPPVPISPRGSYSQRLSVNLLRPYLEHLPATPQHLTSALRDGTPYSVRKQDIWKAFDSTDAGLSLFICRVFGLTEGIARVIEQFYAHQERWMECQGAVASRPNRPKRNLVQGCPASGMLLAAPGTLWIRDVVDKVDGLDCDVFVDDRIMDTFAHDNFKL